MSKNKSYREYRDDHKRLRTSARTSRHHWQIDAERDPKRDENGKLPSMTIKFSLDAMKR